MHILRAGGPPAAALLLCALVHTASAQQKTYTIGEGEEWQVSQAPEAGSDADVIGRAREMIAQGREAMAESLLDGWIERNERTDNPWLAHAYLARGDARRLRDREVPALEDYEEIIKNFPGSDAYVTAIVRELDIGLAYLNGLRKKFLGMRIEPAERAGEEILIRVCQRLPKSRIAEEALMMLGDYYYRVRDMRMAADAYEIFLRLFPQSEMRQRAMQRRVYANIARFKGPAYDASGLREARFLIEDYKARYPQSAERDGLDEALIARLDESAAVQMLETAQWYLRRKDPVAARLTVSRLLRRHPQTVAAIRAQEMIDEYGWTMPRSARVIEEEREAAEDAADAQPAPTDAAPPGTPPPAEEGAETTSPTGGGR